MAHALKVDSRAMNSSEQFASELASIFGVEPTQIRITDHVLESDSSLARIRFIRGRSVAIAISAFLNREFYHPPANENLNELHYSPNFYSFVDDPNGAGELCLTLNEPPETFIGKLRQIASDISFVALHPQMLLALREKGDYRNARQVVEEGYLL
jgi:hypothetical protein